jgi:hypothetical protein
VENIDRAKYFAHPKLIAIDPGGNGGIVVYSLKTKEVVEVKKMPETPGELLSFLRIYSFSARCYLEKVGGMPNNGGSRAFTFGRGFGHLEMALLACRIPVVEVTPQKWQKALQLGNKGRRTETQWKTKLKERAEQLFPEVGKITKATSDALLILEYARLMEKEK